MKLSELVSARHLTDEQRAAAQELQGRGYDSFTDIVQAIGEPALAVLSSVVAEPVAGLAGLATSTFGGVDRSVNVINAVRDKLTYTPKTEAGRSGMNTLGQVMKPVGDALTSAEDYLGGGALELTGSPAIAAAAATIPAALMELNPVGKANKAVTKMDIFAGKKAKNANLEQMEAAQELANRGMDRDTIWKETGWFQDVDSQWKWEIDDSQSGLKNIKEYDFGGASDYESQRLGDVLDSQSISEYPEIGEYRQSIIASENALDESIGGSFEPDSKILRATSKDLTGAKSTAFHETQHAIQEREGFAKGGSDSGFEGQYRKDLHNKDYYASEATNARLEARKTPEYKAVQKKIESKLDNGDKEGLRELLQERRAIENDIASVFDDEVARLAGKTKHTPFEQYKRLAGEAEARNVQTRIDMTPEERAAKPPWQTLDVPEDELIVRGAN
tara:strand:+ start:80 stop:1417 length:1338 start_codon:yes stop_codon:yes gene_type:complete